MTILTLNRKELEKKIGEITEDLEKKITNMGTPIEEITQDKLSVEIFPNRPDLLSLQGFALAINQFNEKNPKNEINLNSPEKDYTVSIDKSVKSVRPYTLCMVVKELKLNEEKIKELIDIQEKLHNSIGRKRKKLAIGIYPLEKIKMPIKFLGKSPSEISFKALGSKIEMSAKQILKDHPAGEEYGHLLEKEETFPIFVDSKDKILSMPPIINSEETGRINEETKEVFIECSGSNLPYLKKCINILALVFSEIGGKVYSMKIKDSKEKNLISPELEPTRLKFNISDIEKTLGIKLSEKEIKKYLAKMGIEYENKKGNSIAIIPPYRADILHWIDLCEDIAIAYGYENFEPEIPEISTIAQEDPFEKKKNIVATILCNLGLLETSSFHITTKKDIKKMHFDYKDFIRLEDSKVERNVLRIDILTNLLQVVSENSDAAYPQKIFEIGKVFSNDKENESETGILEEENLAIVIADEEIGFTDLKQILDYLFKMLDLKYSIEPVENANYILGRAGNIIVNHKSIGIIGEIAPRVLKNWKIKTPIVALEINLDKLFHPK